MGKRIGIYGGTFSPVHIAHINIAKTALSAFNLDEVWVIPAGSPPHKSKDNINPFLRLEMCKIAFKGEENIYIKDFECFDVDKSYTHKTLSLIHNKYPTDKFFLIIGEDSLDSFFGWKYSTKICKYVDFLVATRKNEDESTDNHTLIANKIKNFQAETGRNCQIIPASYISISSTDLRKAVSQGVTDIIHKFLPPEVYEYIKEHWIYEDIPTYDSKKAINLIFATQKRGRAFHCIRVADTAHALAAHYLFPPDIAYIAGLLHDCAKHINEEELLCLCKKMNINVTPQELRSPKLLHGVVGAHIAKQKFNIDERIMEAISVHTRGKDSMSLLDKIIFVADHIEPARNRSHRLNSIRIMAYKNLDLTIVMLLEDTIEYLQQANSMIDDTTIRTYEYYKKITSKVE